MRTSDWSSDVCSSDPLPRLAIGVYLDEVHARGPVLAALSRPGSTIAAVADPGQAGVLFEVEVLHRFFGVDRRRAKAVAGMAQGAIERQRVVWGKSVSVRVDLGGRGLLKKKHIM